MAINFDHDNIVHIRPNGPMLITGVKGSGKTSIGIKKAAFLLENYCLDSDDKILFVNNSKSFFEHSSYLLKRVEQEKVQTLMDLIESNQSKLNILSIDGLIYCCYKKHCETNDIKAEIFNEKEYYLEVLNDGIGVLKLKYPNVVYLDQKYRQFLLAEIEWIRACGYSEEQQYQNAERVGLKDLDREGPNKLNKNSKSRKAIFELMVYFSDCCKAKGLIDFIEANIMALKSAQDGNCKYYTHIIIDDCHELTRIQLDLILQLYRPKNHSSIIFLFEDNTDCDTKAWLGNGRPFTTVGFDMTGRSKTLDLNIKNLKGSNQQIASRHEVDVSITYREFPETDKFIEYIVDLMKQNLPCEDFSIVLNNETTRVELNKYHNLLTIIRKNK